MTASSMWRARAGLGIVALGVLAAACAPGTRANSQNPSGSSPPPATAGAETTPVAGASGPTTPLPARAPAATDPSTDPLTAADTQAADQSLSQIESDLSSTDQATATGENDVPSS